MNAGIKSRIKRIEEQALIGADRQEYERLRRRHYNTRLVTDAALLADMWAIVSQTEEPAWSREEFERPIPANADQHRLIEAESLARDIVSGRPLAELDDPMTVEKVIRVLQERGITGDPDTFHTQLEKLRDRRTWGMSSISAREGLRR